MTTRIASVKRCRNFLLSLFCAVVAGQTIPAAEVDASKLPPPSKKQGVTFDKDIRPLFQASCVRCHSGDRAKNGLRLDTRENVLKGSRDHKVVIPGDSAHSLLVIAAARIDDKTAMPPRPRQPPGGGTPGIAPQTLPGTGADPLSEALQQIMLFPPKALTPEEVGLVRAWIDQGAR